MVSNESVETLIAQWRERADEADATRREAEAANMLITAAMNLADTRTFRACADELAAHLPALRACAEPPATEADGEDYEQPQRTLDIIARMLGWMNTPPRRVFEQEINALKSRVRAEAPATDKGLREALAEARYNARVLAASWQDDARPPADVVKAALAYAIDQRAEALAPSPDPPAQAWQPMESAPTDGTRILGMWHEYPLVQIVCCDADGVWLESNSLRSSPPPDGWMPLPLPPAQAPTDEKENTSRVDGVPGVGQGDLPRKDRQRVISKS